MKRILVCTGVLGGGTALVFAAAVGASVAFPNGGTIAASNEMMFMKGGPVPVAGFGGAGMTTTTIVNADGSVTVTGIAVPVPAPDAATGP
jgi:hypothetical protein